MSKNNAKIKEKDIDNALNILLATGQVFAQCPQCKMYLSETERKKRVCNSCSNKFKSKDIIYISNSNFGTIVN